MLIIFWFTIFNCVWWGWWQVQVSDVGPHQSWSRDPVRASWQYSPFPLGTLENVIDSVVSTCIWLQMIDWDFNLRLFQLVTMELVPAHLSVLALYQDNSIPTGHTWDTRVQWHTSVTSEQQRPGPWDVQMLCWNWICTISSNFIRC